MTNPSSTLPMIYVVGNSHSGSTLLGFLLSTNQAIVNLGELKCRSWMKDRFCSCGHSVANCAFYGDYFPIYNALKRDVVTKIRSTKPLSFFLKKKNDLPDDSKRELLAFYTSLSDRVLTLMPESKYIVDTSKSISMLNGWLNILTDQQIKIIFLKRQSEANISSFIKRGYSFRKAFISVYANNFLIKHYLRKNNLNYLEVDYNRFYANYPEEAQRMSDFIGLPLPSTDRMPVHHHVMAGNSKTKDSFTNKVAAIHEDVEWQHILSKFQKQFLKLIS